MYRLSGQDILRTWESGLAQHPVDRALTILAIAFPGMPREWPANLSIGKRDALLFAIREQTFGLQLNSLVECPLCQERLEFSFSAADLGLVDVTPEVEPDQAELVRQFYQDDYEVQFRLPTSTDLAEAAGSSNLAAARQQLVERCVSYVSRGGEAIALDALPEALIAALANRVAESDPQAAIEIDLSCPACGHRWQTIFDIVSFFWSEISAQARRLLRDVHILAQAYGWREADILSMSTARRQAYLEMVT